ncbi:hypothetical protein ASD42_28025 [Nocardia sp. Root136]|nr:hypothetical protein ASD42_28025 [Nocardia sp. Root136]
MAAPNSSDAVAAKRTPGALAATTEARFIPRSGHGPAVVRAPAPDCASVSTLSTIASVLVAARAN